MNLETRYADAYLIARTVNGTGQTVKFVGFVAAALVMLGGIALAGKIGTSAAFAGLCLAILVALSFYGLGVLISAQGQILMATLDSAVNTSPLLSQEEIRKMLTGSPLRVGVQADPLSIQSSPVPSATPESSLLHDSASPSQPLSIRHCPHCGGDVEPNVSRCRWCMKRI